MRGSIASIGVAEFGARSLLMLLCIYLLPASEAALFGSMMLFVGLFGFAVGFERYVDLQRRMPAMSDLDSRGAIASFAKLIAVGYVALIPPLYLFLVHLCGATRDQALLAVLVAVVEHASQECYRIVLVTHRHRTLLVGSTAKTIAVLLAVIAGGFVRREPLSIDAVLAWWAAIGCAWLVPTLLGISRIIRSGRGGEVIGIRTQLHQSRHHFAVGLVALLAVQADRLVAIRLLGAEELAQYFRAVMTAGAVYQVVTLASYNRVAGDAYLGLQRGAWQAVRRTFRRERMSYVIAVVMVLLCVELVRWWSGMPWLQGALPPLPAVALACAAVLLRGISDFESIVLNHAHRESRILFAKAAAAAVTIGVALALGAALGLPGLLAGAVAGSATGALVLWRSAASVNPKRTRNGQL